MDTSNCQLPIADWIGECDPLDCRLESAAATIRKNGQIRSSNWQLAISNWQLTCASV
jgi:hypothetical protein